MKFSLSSTALSSRLQTLSKVINSKNSLTILDSFLFEVNDNKLKITASDSENIMHIVVDLQNSDANGSFAISNRTILDAVKELPEQPLTFNVDNESFNVELVYQNGKYDFTAQNAQEYPKVKEDEDQFVNIINIPSQQLNNNISRSFFATGNDEIRPVMNGIYFDLTPEMLAIVASDGHKLVRNRLLNIKENQTAAFILPKKPANLLKNILPKDDTNVSIKFGPIKAEISFADTVLVCRLIEGRYPNYNAVVPTENPNKLVVDRLSLLGAIKRVLPFASESTQLIRFNIENNKLELRSEDIDFATKALEVVQCNYTGENMKIGFKGMSLSDILSNLESQEVSIELADPSRAGLVIPSTQPEGEEVVMLIMPMLLND